MLLTAWLIFTGVGGATFLLGKLLGYPGVASIGAVMLIIIGGDVILNDVQIKDGQEISREYAEINGTTVENHTTINDTYTTHSWTTTFATDNAIGIGVLQALVGVLLFYNLWEDFAE